MAYETELGIPVQLAYTEDRVFEHLYKIDPKLAKAWPERFLKAIKTGSDLSLVWPRWMLFILTDEKLGVIQYAQRDQTKKAIEGIAGYFREWIDTGVKPADATRLRAAAAAADAAAAFYRRYGYWPRYYWYRDMSHWTDKNKARYVAYADKLIELLSNA